MIPALAPLPPFRNVGLMAAIQSLGLTTNLKLCLDAGDSSSYPGSGQTWSDLSGTGSDFYRGTGSGSDSADPTFHGGAGDRDENAYFTCDGADYFTLIGSNPSWVNNMHKAGQTQTLAMWVYLTSVSAVQALMGTADASSPGFVFNISSISLNGLFTTLENGSAATITGGPTVAGNAWHFFATSHTNTNGSTATRQIDAASSTIAMDIPFVPSAAAAPAPLRVGFAGGSYSGSLNPLSNGSRIGGAMIWQGTGLTAAQLTAIYNATKSQFGL